MASINEKLNLTIYFILINLYLDFDSYMCQWLVFWGILEIEHHNEKELSLEVRVLLVDAKHRT